VITAAIVDASVAVKWVVQETDSVQARLLSTAKLEAPDLLPIECAYILWKKVRLGDLAVGQASSCLDLLLSSPIVLAGTGNLLDSALRIAMGLNHPIYDCVYLALALRRNVPLVTADGKLVNAVRKHRKLGIRVELLADVR